MKYQTLKDLTLIISIYIIVTCHRSSHMHCVLIRNLLLKTLSTKFKCHWLKRI